ncbi:hypothetical protein ABID95_006587 [Streptomyces atratus]
MHRLGQVDQETLDGAGGVGDLLGQRLQPDDLTGVGPGRDGDLGRARQIAGEAGVDEIGGDAAGPQQPSAGLQHAQFPAAGQVAGRRAVRFEAQQRRAPAAHGEAGLRVEEGGAGGGPPAGRGGRRQPGLEGAEAQLGPEHPVAVLVDQIRHGQYVGHPGLPATTCVYTS